MAIYKIKLGTDKDVAYCKGTAPSILMHLKGLKCQMCLTADEILNAPYFNKELEWIYLKNPKSGWLEGMEVSDAPKCNTLMGRWAV